MAIAQRWLASQFNKDGHDLFDYRIYAFCGDGDLMEGVSNEAASVAGHLGLSNLIWFYDNNHITIEGSTSLAFSDDVATRFRGWHWNVLHVSDVNDLELVDVAIQAAQREAGASDADHRRHPHRLGLAPPAGHQGSSRRGAGRRRGPPHQDGLRLAARCAVPGSRRSEGSTWARPSSAAPSGRRTGTTRYNAWAKEYPDLGEDVAADAQIGNCPTAGTRTFRPSLPTPRAWPRASRARKVLNAVAKNVPWLLGGAADLYPSTKTLINGDGDFEKDSYGGRNFHFGIREHAMGSIVNGMALSRLRPYGATFFIFSDYMRPPIRLAAMMDMPVIFIYTHDSIGLGEDGPTHQPIEQLMSLRAIPRLLVFRPADANEVAETWRVIMPLKTAAGSAGADPPGSADLRPHASMRRRRALPRAHTSWPIPAARPTSS